ncbi:polysaccharide biosynthesis tyrosine autokinase [Mucilaginibacter galii]|uniref:Tyrosine protein kinase n=1 Tax=Mucilaginibacter galii TaxID=2005073 RepID=A0A917JBE4_9SPHI|nr:polysaccharide biosynthesis tyrosine autokinase [Mucilaginibacter galii]GGI51467.1 tyrosine protein kinase [Mucilaginibacter galii]
MSPKLHTNNSQPVEEDTIDIKQILAKILHNWIWFLLSIFFCLMLAYIYAYFAATSWSVASKILVVDEKNSPKSAVSGTLSGDVGSLFSAKSSADNEIQVLKSRTLMKKTVDAMQLNIRTYLKTGLKANEIFEDAPFNVSIAYKADTIVNRTYDIEILPGNRFSISNSNENLKLNAKFGEVIKLNQYNLLLRNKPALKTGVKFEISIQSPDAAVLDFSKNFGVALSDKQATTIDLSLIYSNPAKGEAILNKIMQIYLQSNLQNDKQIADSTMAFIDSRIVLVSKELNNIEKQFEEYKKENNIANISEQSKALVTSASDYYDKLTQQETQLTVISDIERTLSNPKNKNFIPSSLINSTDQSFGQGIVAYNELLRSRDKATLSYTDGNPVIQNLDQQIDNSRINLLNNIETYKKGLQLGKSELQKQNSGFTGQLKELPGKERNYLDFSRQQNLKQELYLFLLQKREETAISRNSTISSSRIIDTAKSDFSPFKPQKSIIYLMGVVIGILLPALFLFVKELFNIQISSKSDIEKATNATILGEIGHNSDKQSLVTGVNSRSVISEQFRSLRTNLHFVLDSSKSNVLLFTSSMSGEGKSFLSLNIGSALALTNKRVVFLEMDLRKPKLSESMGLSNDNGYTNYAISDDENFDYKKLLKPLSFNENCYLISSGPIPPNPAELLENGKLEKLINYLKVEFDYIIVDCAPIGLVTDALMIEKYSDLTFYVIRQGYTYKSQLAIVNDLKNGKVKNLYLIVNDIPAQKGGFSAYGQAYGHDLEQDKSLWKRLF